MNTGSNKISIKICVLLVTIATTFVSTMAFARGGFHVHPGEIQFSQNAAHIKFSVWNCTNRSVTIQLADLPWGENSIGLVVYVAGKRAGEPLAAVHRIADFPIKDVVIGPNSEITDDINLNNVFPSLNHRKDYNNLILFWVYDMSLIQGGDSTYVGGMLPFISSGTKINGIANPCKKIDF